MEIRENPDSNYQYTLVLKGLEVFAMRAMLIEKIEEAASQEDLRQISPDGLAVAKWKPSKRAKELRIRDSNALNETAEWLEEFDKRTPDVIKGVVEVTGIPAYINEHIPERLELGRLALELARHLKQEVEIRSESANIESGLRRLLAEQTRQTREE